jgi:hypothetical protein
LRYVVEFVGVVSVTDDDGGLHVGEVIDQHLDAVMDELENLGAVDPAIELDLSCFQVTLAVMVEAANPVGAASQASGLIRTAIHSARGDTPDWPQPTDEAWAVRLVSMTSAEVAEPNDRESVPA